jgi:hypothetical protein
MRPFFYTLLTVLCFNLSSQAPAFPEPKGYVCHQTDTPLQIDGQALESTWKEAPFTGFFGDIEGDKKPSPKFNTRAKMLWDSTYFYVYAEIEEPDLWASITERDAVIFRDNDFEVFIDPDGDTHHYTELEINALNTVWDLLLTRPYRDGGRPIDHWNIKGLKTAVKLNGTLNDPSDTDKGWSVEIAIPWDALRETTRMKMPPGEGDQWRVNFSRVQWETEVVNGQYVKKKNPDTGKNLPENNWVWSPQRVIAMHEPEFWGVVKFTAQPPGTNATEPSDSGTATEIRNILYAIHRAQRSYFRKNKTYATEISLLDLDVEIKPGFPEGISIEYFQAFDYGYAVVIRDHSGNVDYYINETGLSSVLRK